MILYTFYRLCINLYSISCNQFLFFYLNYLLKFRLMSSRQDSADKSQRIPGSKPHSIKIEPWTDHPKQAYSIHGDDFCHTKPFVTKFTAKGQKSTLNIKQTITKKDGKFNVEDQLKLWFDLPNNHSLYTKIKSTNYVKIHYDHGLVNSENGKKWNIYGSFWTDKALSKNSVRLGVATYHQKCDSDNRLRVDNNSGAHNFHWYHRTMAKHNNFGIGLITVVDLTNRVLQKNNILLSYTHQTKHQGFLRLENDGFRKVNPEFNNVKSIWDSVIANYFVKANSTTKVGLELKFNIADLKAQRVQAVIQKVIPQQKTTLKLRVNSKQEVAFLFKRPLWGFENLATLSVGAAVNNLLTEKRSLSQGIQLDINI